MSQHQAHNHTHSVWQDRASAIMRKPAEGQTSTEVCIVGAGIAGLAVAYQLARSGIRVVVLDDGPVGGGETGRTTAHLASAIDDRFYRIEQVHGLESARLCYQSHAAAIDWISDVVAREAIPCAFERVNGYLFLPPKEDAKVLMEELAAARRAGFVEAEWVERAPLPTFDTGACLRFPGQAQIEPMALMAGLVEALERMGVQIHCGTHVHQIESRNGLKLLCRPAATISAESVVVATNSPINDLVTLHTKQQAYRTFAIALPVGQGVIPHALYWDTAQSAGNPDGPYHYVRVCSPPDQLSGASEPTELVIVGGEDHRTGQENDADDRWARLEKWAKERFPIKRGSPIRWSGQVMEPVDCLAFIGLNPGGPERVYVVTGDSGMGMTHGAIAASLISDLIVGRPNPYEALYDPARQTLRTALKFATDNLNTAVQYGDWLGLGDVDSTARIAPNCGALVRIGLKLLACYRDPQGKLHMRSAACPHLGGVVQWNSAERSWDCPCHGSRFDAFGQVLNGPAIAPLAAVDEPQAVHAHQA